MEIKTGDVIDTSWEKGVTVLGFGYNPHYKEDVIIVRKADEGEQCHFWAAGTLPMLSDDHKKIHWAKGDYAITLFGEPNPKEIIDQMDHRKSISLSDVNYKEPTPQEAFRNAAASFYESILAKHKQADPTKIQQSMLKIVKELCKEKSHVYLASR